MYKFVPKIVASIAIAASFAVLSPGGAEAADILRPGDRGPEVKFLQERLQSVGYNVPDTGVYGSITEAAVEEFQSISGLPADGIVGHQTWEALRNGKNQVSRGQRSQYVIDNIITTAKRFQGVPYLWGGATPQGFDCSGFTQYVFRLNGIELPRTADLQYELGVPVSYNNLQPGDMVFFSTYAPGPSHNGIYIGNGLFINSSSSRGVSIARMDNSYWAPRYIGAKRIIR